MSRPKGIKETRARRTPKRIRLAKELTKKPNSIWEAAIKAGFSNNSRQMYSPNTKRYINEILEMTGNDLESLKKQLEYLKKINLNGADFKEVHAIIADLIRMQGGFKDVRDINVTDKTDRENKILDQYRNRFTDKTEIAPITLGNTAQVCIDDNGMTKDMKDVSGLNPDNSPQSSEDSP